MCQRDGLPTWILLAYQKISSHWISVRKRLQRNFRFQSQDTRQNHTFHLVVFIFFIFFVSIYHLFLQTYTPIKWVELSTRIAPCCSHLFVSGYHGPPPEAMPPGHTQQVVPCMEREGISSQDICKGVRAGETSRGSSGLLTKPWLGNVGEPLVGPKRSKMAMSNQGKCMNMWMNPWSLHDKPVFERRCKACKTIK